MKKRIILLVVLAISATTAAWAQTDTLTLSIAVSNPQMGTVTLSDTNGSTIFGNLVKGFLCTSASQYGVCTDGTYIYTSSWTTSVADGYMFHQYNMNGDSVDAFTIQDVSPIRDLTTDGTYFYGGSNNSTIYVMDFATRTLVRTIECTGAAIRHITYDPVREGFWVGNWSTLSLYDLEGNKMQDGPVPSSASGTAYYMNGNDGHLLLFVQPSSDALVFDYDITNDTVYADTVCDVNATSEAEGISGGSFIGTYNGRLCWFGDVQQSPNIIGIYPIVNIPTDSIDKDVISGTQWIVTATPREGYRFVSWSDENTDNPRTLTVNSDTELRAFFMRDNSVVGDDVTNEISVYASNGHIVVLGAEDMEVGVYDVMGREVLRANGTASSTFVLPQGVYIVKVGDQPARKVVVLK